MGSDGRAGAGGRAASVGVDGLLVRVGALPEDLRVDDVHAALRALTG